jgi:hypothetical protein
MKQSACPNCNKVVSTQNMRKHKKTQTCKNFVLSDFDKEVMRLCEEKEMQYNSDYESDSDDTDQYSDSDIEEEYAVIFGYDMLDTETILQLKAKIKSDAP